MLQKEHHVKIGKKVKKGSELLTEIFNTSSSKHVNSTPLSSKFSEIKLIEVGTSKSPLINTKKHNNKKVSNCFDNSNYYAEVSNAEFFGEYEDLFITDENLKVSQEKLEEEKSKETVLKEMVHGLKKFEIKLTHFEALFSMMHLESKYTFSNVSICYNFIVLGTNAKVMIYKAFLLIEANLLNSFKATYFKFNFDRISDIRLKIIDENEFLCLICLNDNEFFQFQLKDVSTAKLFCETLQKQHSAYNKEYFNERNIRLFPPNDNDDVATKISDSENQLSLIKELNVRRKEVEKKKEASLRKLNEIIDLARKSYEDEILCYEAELKKFQLQVLTNIETQQISSDVIKNSNILELKMECQICFDNNETKEFQPCLHKVCNTCFEKLYVASEEKNDISKMYCPWDRIEVTLIKNI